MTAIDGRDIAATLLPGFVGTSLPSWLRARLRSGLGGVCLFAQNIASPDQVRALTREIRAANPRAVIAIDEEGGDVTRIFADRGSPYPGNAILGRIDDPDTTESVGRAVGTALRSLGCTLALAPDVDVNSNPDNPVIGVRSFGDDPARVAVHGVAWTTGLQSTGVAACAKHFPGHGDTGQDSHLALPVVDRSLVELRARELVPFRAIVSAGSRAVMTSHILLPQLDVENPATFSRRIVTDLLRDELAFRGVVVTDALDMAGASAVTGIPVAAVRALAAGCDLLCIGTENTDEQLDEIEREVGAAVEAGRLVAERVREAAERVRSLADPAAITDARASAVAGAARNDADAALGDLDVAPVDPDRIRASFDLHERAAAWIARRVEHPHATLVQVNTEANIAVGAGVWGPRAFLRADPDSAASVSIARWRVIDLQPHDLSAVETIGAGERVVVVGRDNHRHEVTRQTIDTVRSRGADVLAVDMGWPSSDRRYADLATFGASRVVGGALLDLLTGVRG